MAVVSTVVAVATTVAGAVSTAAGAIGGAVSAGLGAVGISSGAAGIVGSSVATGVKFAAGGALIGGTVSEASGGKFLEGAWEGAKMGFAVGAGGALGGAAFGSLAAPAAFVPASTAGGFIGGSLGAKAVGATNRQALMAGVAMGAGQFAAASWQTGAGAAANAPTGWDAVKAISSAHPVASMIAVTAGLQAISGAVTPTIPQGFEYAPGKAPESEEEEGKEKEAAPFQAASRKISDVSAGGVGLNRAFNPASEVGYQAQPQASGDVVAASRKAFLKEKRGLLEFGMEYA